MQLFLLTDNFLRQQQNDEVDKGVLMICDPRIIDKPYGKRIWKSLPAFKRTRQEIDVMNFLKSL